MRTFEKKPMQTHQTASAIPMIRDRAHSGQSRNVNSILHLQRTIGNHAGQRLLDANRGESSRTDMARFGHNFSRIPVYAAAPAPVQRGDSADLPNIHATRGLKADAEEDEILRGRTVGEFIGDVARPVGAALGNVVGSIAGALTGISISSTTNRGPTWNNDGAFVWRVGFSTTGRNGWLVQDIVNTWRAENAARSAVPSPFTAHYWEAWAVDGTGSVAPSVGTNNDYWDNPNFRAAYGAVQGHWATTGKVYFTTIDPATQGFVASNPATNAGDLLSTTTAPASLGIARLHRYAQGTWDSTGVAPTHTGSAGP